MSINLEVLRETIKERKRDMSGNRSLTNELAIDDLMIILGYNKKRDTSVYRLYDKDVDWKVVYPTGSRIAVRTFAVDEEVNEDEAAGTFNLAVQEDTATVILTNGTDIKIYAINNFEQKYVEVAELNIFNELDAITNKVLTLISKSGFDRSAINDIVMSKYITSDKVKEWLNKYSSDIVNIIIKNEKLKDSSRLSPLYTELINAEPKVEAVTEKVVDTAEIESLNKEIEALNDKINIIEEEKANISNENESLKANIANLEVEKDSAEKLIEELTNAKTMAENEKVELENKLTDVVTKEEVNELNNQYNNALDQISGLTLQNKSLMAQIEKLQAEIDEKITEIARIESEKSELSQSIEDLRGEVNKLNTLSVDDYIQQIHDLTEQCNCITEERDVLAAKVKKLQEEINDLEGVDRKKAQELLDVIQVADDQPRQYVGVINTELFQYPQLNKFVGCVLQKLSELKGHLAAQYIFDGDMFTLIPNGENKDLMINNKYFDISLDNMGEAEAINKLRIIFSHFDDLIFDCKMVGKLPEDSDDIEYTLDQNINRDVNADLEVEEKRFKISLFKKDETPENNQETAEEYVDEQYEEQSNYIEPQDYLMVVQLQTYFDMFMAEVDENTTLGYTNVKYIGSNNATFRITEDNLDKQLVKCIDALLAIEAGRGRASIIKEFKQCDLRDISEYILRYDTTTKDLPKITAAKYCVSGIETVAQMVKVLYDICEQMQIDMSDIFVYANAYTNAMDLVNAYSFDEASVVLYDNTECQYSDDGTESAAIIKGDIFNNIIFTHNSLGVHSQLIKMAVGVKTKYMSQTIASYDDFVNTVGLLVTNALNNKIDNNIICRCTTLDGTYKLVSDNEADVSARHKQIEANGQIYFVSFVENWEIAESLLRIHTDIYNDTAIAIKVLLKNNMLGFINNEFYTSEPSLALAVYSFRNYINNAIK